MNNQTMYNDLLGVKPRKHSYRELAKRRFTAHVIYFIWDHDETPQNIFELHPEATKKQIENVNRAYNLATHLVKQYKEGENINFYPYTGLVNEMKKALKNTLTSNQLNFNL
jgi:hypothetical protein